MKHNRLVNKLSKIAIRQNSIRFKIFQYFAIFSLIIILFLWLFQVVLLEKFYHDTTIQNLKGAASTIQRNLNNENLSLLVQRLVINSDFSIRVVSVDDTSLDIVMNSNSFNTYLSRLSTIDMSIYYLLARDNNGTYTFVVDKSSLNNDNYNSQFFTGNVPQNNKGFEDHIVYIQLMDVNEQSYLFLGYAQLAPIDPVTSTLQRQLLYVSALFLALSAFFTWFISKKISDPIVKMNDSAKILATGDYDVSFEGKGYCEITELNSTLNYATKELKKVDELRKELIANISHDLRTPLTMISGYSEVMRDIPAERSEENLQIIIDETTRLSGIVNDILELSRYQADAQVLQVKECNLTAMINAILERYRKLDQQNFQFLFHASKEITVMMDELKMSQVLYNLLNNAINYSQDDKRIIVNQSFTSETVTIEVINFGKEIAPDELPYIYERYYRSKENHVRAVKGSGLGLSIVKNVIRMHHGSCAVTSVSGTTCFSFTIPIAYDFTKDPHSAYNENTSGQGAIPDRR